MHYKLASSKDSVAILAKQILGTVDSEIFAWPLFREFFISEKMRVLKFEMSIH